MMLGLKAQFVATPIDSASSASCSFASVEDVSPSCVRSSSRRTGVCMQGPILASKMNNTRQREHLSTSFMTGETNNLSSFTTQRNGIFINELAPSRKETGLIDVEDSSDGTILFKYGGLEDLWELDKLLEFLCRGAFSTYNIESLVPVIFEMLRVPISAAGQRRMVDFLSSYIRSNRGVHTCDVERQISELLAEATSEYLPPPCRGNFKGSRRPYKRFSSSVDRWWREVDNYLDGAEEGLDHVGDEAYAVFNHRRFDQEPQAFQNFDNLNGRNFVPLRVPSFETLDSSESRLAWEDARENTNWFASPSIPTQLDGPKSLDLVRESESSSNILDGDYTVGLGFVVLSLQVNTLEDVLKRSELLERNPKPEVPATPPSRRTETLSAKEIQDMLEWEREEVAVTCLELGRKKGLQCTKKMQTTPRTRSKTSHLREQTKGHVFKTATKRKSTTEKRRPQKLCDFFFTLPPTNSNSGVASFLAIRQGLSKEIVTVLNQGSVMLAGGGLAVVLHVVARMLSVNSSFDSSKLFGVIRAAALMWLSASMQSLRSVLMRLPADCTVASCKDKQQLLCLQQRLRTLSVKALTVMVLSVVGAGF